MKGNDVIEERLLTRNEINKVWRIDRSELIEAVYSLVDGRLVLSPEHYDAKGWPDGEAEKYTPILEDCYDRGGWFYGIFQGDNLIGVAVLESQFIGADKDQLQLKFLHVSRKYRGKGFGKRLFDLAVVEARQRGANSLYISATPSEHTVNFYMRLGCKVTLEPDKELFELEPEDIHLEYNLGK
jgi:predicted N-acetyltransferase YhbS